MKSALRLSVSRSRISDFSSFAPTGDQTCHIPGRKNLTAGSIIFLFTGLESTGAMPKFYVQSGSFRGIVERENADLAALWAVETVMRSPKPNSRERMLSDQRSSQTSDELRSDSESYAESRIGLFRLADAIGVSECGFNRKSRQRIPTSDAMLLWMLRRRTNEQKVTGETSAP